VAALVALVDGLDVLPELVLDGLDRHREVPVSFTGASTLRPVPT